MNDSKPPKAKLRWYQFSLRTLLGIMFFVALGLGLFSQRMPRILNEINATAELLKLGARIQYYPQENWRDVLSITDRWIWKFFADTPARSVTLGSQGYSITNSDLKHLKELSKLKSFNLYCKQVTDDGLEHLEGLENLQNLHLQSTQFTDAGLEHLKGLTSLQSLSLIGTQVADTGLEHLKGMTKLSWLHLGDTQVTDTGLEHLKGMSSIQELHLRGTQVTDAGLEHLKGLASLQKLDLQNTQVTDEGVKNLQQALPKCNISH